MNNLNYKTIQHLLPIIFLFLFVNVSKSQSEASSSNQWSKYIEGKKEHTLYGIAKDKQGNIIATGKLEGTGIVEDGDDMETVSEGRTEAFIIKYDSKGDVIWKENYGIPGGGCIQCRGPVVGRDVVVDLKDDSYYLGGYFQGGTSFKDEGETLPGLDGSVDGIIVKYDKDNKYQYRIRIGGSENEPGEDAKVWAIDVDEAGNLYAAGTFANRAHILDSDPLTLPKKLKVLGNSIVLTSNIWIAKFDNKGKLLWYNMLAGNGNDIPFDIKAITEENRVVVTGAYESDLAVFKEDDFENKLKIFPDAALRATNAFIATFDMNGKGEPRQIQAIESPAAPFFYNSYAEVSGSSGNQLVLEDDYFYLTGSFVGETTFHGSSNPIQITAKGAKDAFIAKYYYTLDPIWVKSFGGEGFDTGDALDINGDSLIIGGRFGRMFGNDKDTNDSIIFDEGGKKETTLTSKGKDDIMIVRVDKNDGDFLSVEQFGGNKTDRIRDLITTEEGISFGGDFESDTLAIANDTMYNILNHKGTNAFVSSYLSAALTINIFHTNNDTEEKAAYVELWTKKNETVVKKLEKIEEGSGEEFYKVDFFNEELEDYDIYECYLLREDKTLIGRIHIRSNDKNRKAGRSKEVIVTLHNDLASYDKHPIDEQNINWKWKNWYKYDYKDPLLNILIGKKIDSDTYPVSMLIPPVNNNASYELSNVKKERKPILYIHGFTDVDNEWGALDTTILPKEMTMEQDKFWGDYAQTSIPSRVRTLSKDGGENFQADCWEFYYPPESDWGESALLLKRDIPKILEKYNANTKLSLVSYSMGALVSGAYISGIAKGYDTEGEPLGPEKIAFDNNIGRNLILASPMHGSFLANRAYWLADDRDLIPYLPDPGLGPLGLENLFPLIFSCKDPHSAGLREAAVGSRFVLDLLKAREDNPPGMHGDGVEYLCVVGTEFEAGSCRKAEEIVPIVVPFIIDLAGAKGKKGIALFILKKLLQFLIKNQDIELSVITAIDVSDKVAEGTPLDAAFEAVGLQYLKGKAIEFALTEVGKLLDDKVIKKSLESTNHADNTVSLSSGSLLRYGIDLIVLDGFNHGEFTQLNSELKTIEERNLIPNLIKDFLIDGNVSSRTESNFLSYIKGDAPEAIHALPQIVGTPKENIVRYDIGLPITTFKIKDTDDYWKPADVYDGYIQTSFQFVTRVNLSGELVGFLEKYHNDFRLGGYRKKGLYLYYGGNNHNRNFFKRKLNGLGNPIHDFDRTEAFYGFSSPLEKPDADNIYKRNPLSLNSDKLTIKSDGLGWHIPESSVMDLDVYLNYRTTPLNVHFEMNDNPVVTYAFLNGGDYSKFTLRWLQTTYTEFLIDQNAVEILGSIEIRDDALPSGLNEGNFVGQTPSFGPVAKSRTNNSELINWVDSHIKSASFVVSFTEDESLPEMVIESPSGQLFTASDTSSSLLYNHNHDLNVAYFTVLNPEVGKWKLLLNGLSEIPSGNYNISYPMNLENPLNLNLQVDSTENDIGLVLTATLVNKQIQVSNQDLFVYYFDENGMAYTLDAKDDGVWPDTLSGDGVFSTIFERPDTQAYEIVGAMWGKMEGDNFVRQSAITIPECDLKADILFLEGCVGDSLNFFNDSQSDIPFSATIWKFSDGTYSEEFNTKLAFDSAGIYSVVFKVKTILGCQDSVIREIVVHERAKPKLLDTLENCLNGQLNLDAGKNFTAYQWSTIIDTTQFLAPNSTDSTYFAVVLDSLGCFALSDTIHVDYPTCPIPQSTTIQNQSDSLLQFTWESDTYEGDTWQMVILPKNEAPGDSGLVVIGTSYEKKGMASGDYDFYVRSMCGAEIGGCWDGPYEFSVGGSEEFINLAGNVHTEYNTPVNNVSLKWTEADSTTTSDKGIYDLGTFRSGSNLEIIPYKNTDPTENLTTTDLVQIVQHVLSLKQLDSPYKIIAADANRSGTITVTDLVILQALILGIKSDFRNNTSWRFIPKDYVFQNPENPLLEDFPEKVSLSEAIASQTDLDFIGVKIGDVTYDLDSLSSPEISSRSINDLLLNIDNQPFKNGEIITIPFYSNESSVFLGYQMELSFDKNQFEFLELITEDEQGSFQYAQHQLPKGLLPLNWVNIKQDESVWDKERPLFILKLKAKKSGFLKDGISLNKEGLVPEIYFSEGSEHLQIKPIAIQFKEGLKGNDVLPDPIRLFPNPVHKKVEILGLDAATQIELFDLYGRQIIIPLGSKRKGVTQIDLMDLTNGTYWLRIKIGERIVNKKIVKISN